MTYLLETGNVEDAAKAVYDMKPSKRYIEPVKTDTAFNCF